MCVYCLQPLVPRILSGVVPPSVPQGKEAADLRKTWTTTLSRRWNWSPASFGAPGGGRTPLRAGSAAGAGGCEGRGFGLGEFAGAEAVGAGWEVPEGEWGGAEAGAGTGKGAPGLQ